MQSEMSSVRDRFLLAARVSQLYRVVAATKTIGDAIHVGTVSQECLVGMKHTPSIAPFTPDCKNNGEAKGLSRVIYVTCVAIARLTPADT